MSEALHVVDATMFWSPTGGGVRRYLLAKQAWFAARPGWRHTVAVPRIGAAPAIGAVAATGLLDVAALPPTAHLPSWPLPFSGGYRLPIARREIADAIARLRPGVIEAGDPYRVAWGALDAARRTGAGSVAFCHSNLEAMGRLVAGAAGAALARRYLRHLYRRFDLVLTPSRAMQRHLAALGVAAEVQPLGVDSHAFCPARADRIAWRRSLGLADEARVLVYAGRFAAEKHLGVLVDAVGRLGAPYVFVAIGAGPLPPRSSERVRVLPFQAGVGAVATALASADAFVHAGDQETFGLSTLEAMASATPVVVRAAEGLAELVEGGAASGGGIGVERGDGAAFAEAIEALFAGDMKAAGAAARARAEAYAWPLVLPRLEAHYRRLQAGPRGSAAGAAAAPAVARTP